MDFLYNLHMNHILDTEEQFFVATKLCLICQWEILTLTESYPWIPLWRELPGGKISKSDGDNSPYFTLKREVYEELWLSIDFDPENAPLFHIEKRYEKTTKWNIRPFIFLCYRYFIDVKPDISLTEHSGFAWISADDVEKYTDWRPGFDTIVRKAFRTPFPDLIPPNS